MQSIPIHSLLPHRAPILMVDELFHYDGENGSVGAVVQESNPFLDQNDTLLPAALIEIIAQSFAVCNGYEGLINDTGIEPRTGLLVAIRKFETFGPVRVGDKLRIDCRKRGVFDEFTIIEGIVFRNEERIAQAAMHVWVKPDKN